MRFTEIGQQLRAYRMESGLRAEEIAARLGVSRAALYRYEKGEVIKLDTIKRLAELLQISAAVSLLGIGVEYYNRPIGYLERLRQVEETADQILQLSGPVCYLTTSDAYDNALVEAFEEAADQVTAERTAMRSMAEQVLGILSARKRMYALRRPGIIAMASLASVQRMLLGRRGGLHSGVSDRLRRICRDVATTEVREHGLADGGGADGPAVRAADRAGAILGVQDPTVPRPGQSGDQPVPSRHAPVGPYRGGYDHRCRRGDRGAPAGGGGDLARRPEGHGRRNPAAATRRNGGACLTPGSSPGAGSRGGRRGAASLCWPHGVRSFPALPAHPDVEVCSEQRVWSGRFPLDVVRFRHRRFDGTTSGVKTWEVWRRGRAAAVLPYDPVVDAVVLIEQFRLPALMAGLDPVLVELPAGLCDDGETPEATARREMMEEMGLAVGTLRRIGGVLLTPGGADEVCELVRRAGAGTGGRWRRHRRSRRHGR